MGSIVIAHRFSASCDLGLRGDALAPERARHAVLLGDLADDRAPARLGGRQAERGGDRRLADAALSGDVDEAPVLQECFHRGSDSMTMPAMDPALTAAYETCRRMHRRHDPTYYWATRRLPADVRPATHALYGYVRTADQLVDGPRRAPTPEARRAALDAWEGELARGLHDGALGEPGRGRARRRGPPPRPAAGGADAVHALDAGRLRAGADRQLGGARRLHGGLGRLGRADHGAAARRPRAPPRRLRPARAGVPARQLHPRRRRGLPAGPDLPAARRTASASASPRPTSRAPSASPRAARAGRARGRRARAACSPPPARPSPPRPPPCGPGIRLACAVYESVLDRVEAAGYDVLGRRMGVRALAACRCSRSGRCAGDAPRPPCAAPSARRSATRAPTC